MLRGPKQCLRGRGSRYGHNALCTCIIFSKIKLKISIKIFSLKELSTCVSEKKWWGSIKRIEGEGVWDGLDQNTLYTCIEFLNDK